MKSKTFCIELERHILKLQEYQGRLEDCMHSLEKSDTKSMSLDVYLENIEKCKEKIETTLLECSVFLYEKIAKELEVWHKFEELIFHSPYILHEKLAEVGIEIPKDEMNRMLLVIAGVDIEEVKEKYTLLKKYTEGNKVPLLMVLPQKVKIEGEVIECSIHTLQTKLWPNLLRKKDFALNRLTIFSDYVKNETRTRMWNNKMVAYTSAVVQNTHTMQTSKGLSYSEQEQLVIDTLGKDSTIGAEILPVMIFHHLITGEVLMKYKGDGYMRLHEMSKYDTTPLCVLTAKPMIVLTQQSNDADDEVGIGASFEFSSKYQK